MHMEEGVLIPLTPTTLYALIVLSQGEMHAYMVGQQMIKYSNGLIVPDRATISRLLKRLVRNGWVIAEAPIQLGRTRQGPHYAITPLGKRVCISELNRLRQLVYLTDRFRLRF